MLWAVALFPSLISESCTVTLCWMGWDTKAVSSKTPVVSLDVGHTENGLLKPLHSTGSLQLIPRTGLFGKTKFQEGRGSRDSNVPAWLGGDSEEGTPHPSTNPETPRHSISKEHGQK